MRIRTALRAVAAFCALSCAPQTAFAQCTRLLSFETDAVCAANRPEILELATGATATACSRSLRCPLRQCITVTLAGDEASCARLQSRIEANEMLKKEFMPPCVLTVDGKPFGRVYDADDRSRHFKFNTSAGVVDYALSGSNAAQRVPIPATARKCIPKRTTWECSGFADKDILCYQPGTGFDNGPPLVKFDKRGDFGVCADLARTLQQAPSILSVASCLMPPPAPVRTAPAQPTQAAAPDPSCEKILQHPTTGPAQSIKLCLAERGIDKLEECCSLVRAAYQEQSRRDNERIQGWKDAIRRVVPGTSNAGGTESGGAAPR